jgi:non-heme chloroperoxidase
MGATQREESQVERANATGRQPVLFIHGLWLLSTSWARWARVFEEAGYAAVVLGWPDDPETTAEANANPDALAGKTIRQVADHYEGIARALDRRPAIVGHSFGGLLAQILAGRGASVSTVAISPAPFQGVLPLPFSALKSASPVLGNPANRDRAVPLTLEQFRYAFANAVTEAEAEALYREFAVPAPGAPLFQAALANLNPWTEDRVDTRNPARGPLLILSGSEDHTVPWAVSKAAYDLQKTHNPGVTEIQELTGRGHAITIDHGWRDVADTALGFIKRFV